MEFHRTLPTSITCTHFSQTTTTFFSQVPFLSSISLTFSSSSTSLSYSVVFYGNRILRSSSLLSCSLLLFFRSSSFLEISRKFALEFWILLLIQSMCLLMQIFVEWLLNFCWMIGSKQQLHTQTLFCAVYSHSSDIFLILDSISAMNLLGFMNICYARFIPICYVILDLFLNIIFTCADSLDSSFIAFNSYNLKIRFIRRKRQMNRPKLVKKKGSVQLQK